MSTVTVFKYANSSCRMDEIMPKEKLSGILTGLSLKASSTRLPVNPDNLTVSKGLELVRLRLSAKTECKKNNG